MKTMWFSAIWEFKQRNATQSTTQRDVRRDELLSWSHQRNTIKKKHFLFKHARNKKIARARSSIYSRPWLRRRSRCVVDCVALRCLNSLLCQYDALMRLMKWMRCLHSLLSNWELVYPVVFAHSILIRFSIPVYPSCRKFEKGFFSHVLVHLFWNFFVSVSEIYRGNSCKSERPYA